MIETITEDDKTNVNAFEATAIIKIEGSDVRVKLDTGAEVNIMPKRVYDQLKKSNKKITKASVKLHGYGAHDISVIGKSRLEYSVNDVPKSTEFYVAHTKNKTIFGLKCCRDVMLVKIMDEINEKFADKKTDEENQKNIIEENVKRINGKKGDDLKQEILKLYAEVFTGLGRLEPLCHIQLKENSTPVIHALRKIPFSLRSKIKKELDDRDGSLRLCLDPKDLNKVIKREHFELISFEDISNKIGRGSSLHEIREQRKSDLH